MEEVEEANRAAIETCHGVLNLLAAHHQHQPLQDQVQLSNLMVETGEAVFKFRKVLSLLNSGFGHARVRRFNKIPPPPLPNLPQKALLDCPIYRPDPPSKNLHPFQPGLNGKVSIFMGNPDLELGQNDKNSLQIPKQAAPSLNFSFPQQQQQQHQQRLLAHQKQMKQQAELMFLRSNSGMNNLNFDSSNCTLTMSSARSFISSLSMDGSVADGSSFHLIGPSSTSADNKRKFPGRGDEGSLKCGSTGKCHCSKKRLD